METHHHATKNMVDLSGKNFGLAISNLDDCRRYGCPETPWHWATNWVRENARLTGSEIVCDLGAGDNPFLQEEFAQNAATAYLVDDLTLPAAEKLPDNIKRIEGNIGALPFDDAAIDVVVSVSVLEHLTPTLRAQVFSEIARILKPRGRAVLTIGNHLNANENARRLFTTLDFFTARHCPVYLPLGIHQLLRKYPALHLNGMAERAACCPGDQAYREETLLKHPGICVERFDEITALDSYPDLQCVVSSEVGLILNKKIAR